MSRPRLVGKSLPSPLGADEAGEAWTAIQSRVELERKFGLDRFAATNDRRSHAPTGARRILLLLFVGILSFGAGALVISLRPDVPFTLERTRCELRKLLSRTFEPEDRVKPAADPCTAI